MPGPELTGVEALGGPIDERTPLYSRLAALAAEHPGQPLPNQGEDVLGPYPDRPEPVRPLEADGDPETTRADEWLAPRLARSLRWFLTESPRDRDALRRLYPELVGVGSFGARTAVRALDPVAAGESALVLARWLCRYAADRGPVKVGLDLLAEAATEPKPEAATATAADGAACGASADFPADEELLSTLALADGEFTSEAIAAMRRTLPDPEPAIFAVARRLAAGAWARRSRLSNTPPIRGSNDGWSVTCPAGAWSTSATP